MDSISSKPSELEVNIIGPADSCISLSVSIFENGKWESLSLTASYNLAGYNYTLRDLGDGYAMFDGAVNVVDYVMEDYMVLANYVQAFEGGTVGATNSPLCEKYPNLLMNYASPTGACRIVMAQTSLPPCGNGDSSEGMTSGSGESGGGETLPEGDLPPAGDPSSVDVPMIVTLACVGTLAVASVIWYVVKKKRSK